MTTRDLSYNERLVIVRRAAQYSRRAARRREVFFRNIIAVEIVVLSVLLGVAVMVL